MFAVVWLGCAIALWYSNRDSWIGGSRTVVPLYTAGALIYMGLLARSLKLKLKDINRETWIVVGGSLALFALFWHFEKGSPFPTHTTLDEFDLYTLPFLGLQCSVAVGHSHFIGTKVWVLSGRPGYQKGTSVCLGLPGLAWRSVVWYAANLPLCKYPCRRHC